MRSSRRKIVAAVLNTTASAVLTEPYRPTLLALLRTVIWILRRETDGRFARSETLRYEFTQAWLHASLPTPVITTITRYIEDLEKEEAVK